MKFSLRSLTSSWWRRGRLKGPEFKLGAALVKPVFVNAIRLYKLIFIRALGFPGILWCYEILR
jgi:hypothetical protein